MEDSNPDALLAAIIEELNKRNVSFIQMNEGPMIGLQNDITAVKDKYCERFRNSFKGTWIGNFGFT